MSSIDDPEWSEIFTAALDRRQMKINTAATGVVTRYHPDAQTVEVQIVVQEPGEDEDDWVTIPPLTDVPIAWPAGGGYGITMPLAPGDPVVVVFAQSNDSHWRATGEIAPPFDVRRHGLGSPKAIPCGGLDGRTLPAQDGKLVISSNNGSGPGIVLDGSVIEIGGSDSFVALASKVNDELSKIADAFASFSPGSGGATFTTPYTSASDVSATKVKVS